MSSKKESIKPKALKLTDERSYFKPFSYQWCYEAWLKHEQAHWLHTEVPMFDDLKDWKSKLSEQEKYFLSIMGKSAQH